MSSVDIVLIVLGLFGFYKGFKNGILIEITTLIALVLGFYGAQHLASFTAKFLNDTFNWNPEQLYTISMVITFTLIVIAVYLIGKALTKVASMILLGGLNKIIGGFFGLFKMAIIMSVMISYGNEFFNLSSYLPEKTLESSLGFAPLESMGEFLLNKVFVSDNLEKIKALF